MINGYCQVSDYPFRNLDLPTEAIDSYHGKFNQSAKAYINNVNDSVVIGFGTIDDIDQLEGKRGDHQASASQLEITAALMESLAGANII